MNTTRSWAAALLFTLSFATPRASDARPPNTEARGFREGANHHIGDDSFVARFGRLPDAHDAEALRMHTHLAHVRDMLASGVATRPELAPMRARVIRALSDYVAKGMTPENMHLPWRNPVFIDDDGTICAVGYLIAETAGRDLADKVAATHRYDMIEDIAASMPEVAAWVASSGLTLEEVSTIQPGYEAPIVETWHPWNLAKAPLPDGPVEQPSDDGAIRGSIRHGQMDGTWTRAGADKRLVGSGELRGGAGTWKSVYPDGAPMAEGSFAHNVPDGPWRFFHPSGNLAAQGRFHRGIRSGFWSFFYDGEAHTPIAWGHFVKGRVSGLWRHFDQHGSLLADSVGGSLDIVPNGDHVQHSIEQGNVAGDHIRVDMLFDGSERLYVRYDAGDVYDAQGHKLTQVAGAWQASDCKWSPVAVRAAGVGDLGTLYSLDVEMRSSEACDGPQPLSPERVPHVERMLASVRAVRSASPEFIRKLVLGEGQVADAADGKDDDLAKVLAANMTWYIEWPHLDQRFIALFHTLPGYARSTDGT